MDTVIKFLDTDGRISIVIYVDSGTGVTARIEWITPLSGTYFISVGHSDKAEAGGGYDLTASQLGYGHDHANEARGVTPLPGRAGRHLRSNRCFW